MATRFTLEPLQTEKALYILALFLLRFKTHVSQVSRYEATFFVRERDRLPFPLPCADY